MSQAKVDRYKQEKANRQKIVRKQKLMHRLEMAAIALVCVVVLGWVGYSVYAKVTDKDAVQDAIAFDAGAVQDYLSGLTAEAQ